MLTVLIAISVLLPQTADAKKSACLKAVSFMDKFDYDDNGLIQKGDQKKFADDLKAAVSTKNSQTGLDTNGDSKADFFKDLNKDGKVDVVDVVRYNRLNVNGDSPVDVKDITVYVAKTNKALGCSQLGDVNMDAKVNKKDISALNSLILKKKHPNPAKRQLSDLNKDGKVNVQDLVKLTAIVNAK